MRYAKLIKNDIVNTLDGITVSLWTQGCPHMCKGCHNPETWNQEGGLEKNKMELALEISQAITAHNIKRNFSILGGEPLSEYNKNNVLFIIKLIKEWHPNIEIYLWTGYKIEELTSKIDIELLNNINYLIDGKFIEKEKNLSLKLRGSENQRIFKTTIIGNILLSIDN